MSRTVEEVITEAGEQARRYEEVIQRQITIINRLANQYDTKWTYDQELADATAKIAELAVKYQNAKNELADIKRNQ